MKFFSLSRSTTLPLLGCLLLAAPLAVRAQSGMDDMNGPPPVLVIQREYLKPGKAGATHEKSERAFVLAAASAKTKSYYFGLDSMSGPSRSLFLLGYPSFEAWEKDNLAQRKDTALTAAFDKAEQADGELLSEYDSNTLALRADLSLHTGNLVKKRYMDISRYEVKPGHTKEWDALVKLYIEGYKNIPGANWATFEMMYGVSTGPTYLVISTYKTLAEEDAGMTDSKKFEAALGEAGMKKLNELAASCIVTYQANLFEINPKISYPPPSWIDAEPDFWKPKAGAAVAKKPAQ